MTAEAAILALLEERAPGRTIRPTEAAKALAGAGGDWRARMNEVHIGVDTLLEAGEIALSWKGEPLGQRRGAYRIARR
ncbi:DUF3253 domain-containing protein [Erythrobacter sp.]|jgi:hypothetical protein|uniref:DUF3253 domain-containing protein n=1 Tax=Erythrobacter sp. TaxID=1042 RepID=UPI002EB79E33|nr:DUF3253 domain-containing protein [Erythrobacter sp.]